MNNKMNPRAKIGDVVIVITVDGPIQQIVRDGNYSEEESQWMYWCSDDIKPKALRAYMDKYILKNLTTNESYE